MIIYISLYIYIIIYICDYICIYVSLCNYFALHDWMPPSLSKFMDSSSIVQVPPPASIASASSRFAWHSAGSKKKPSPRPTEKYDDKFQTKKCGVLSSSSISKPIMHLLLFWKQNHKEKWNHSPAIHTCNNVYIYVYVYIYGFVWK